jgi:uncharacterized protein with HEPN domain
MRPDVPKWLDDIRDSAAYILAATQDESVESYEANRTLRQAVERNFEIIGEAVNRIRRSERDVAERLGDLRQIIAFRNVLIHGYDYIDVEIVWRVIQARLPELLRTVEDLLRGI